MLTLRDLLNLNYGKAVEVRVKEPNKCAKYTTVLKDGFSNIHTDNDLDRTVYAIGLTYNACFNDKIICVDCW